MAMKVFARANIATFIFSLLVSHLAFAVEIDLAKAEKIASDGVEIRTSVEGSALRIEFDFSRGAGFGGVILPMPMDLPANYDISFAVRGEGPANNLELKLVDESK